jgi:hypothetical protein
MLDPVGRAGLQYPDRQQGRAAAIVQAHQRDHGGDAGRRVLAQGPASAGGPGAALRSHKGSRRAKKSPDGSGLKGGRWLFGSRFWLSRLSERARQAPASGPAGRVISPAGVAKVHPSARGTLREHQEQPAGRPGFGVPSLTARCAASGNR